MNPFGYGPDPRCSILAADSSAAPPIGLEPNTSGDISGTNYPFSKIENAKTKKIIG